MQSALFASDPVELGLPGAEITYLPGFIADHQTVFDKLAQDLQWQQDQILMYGKRMPIPRLNAWYADSGMAYSYSGIDLSPLPWTQLLIDLKAAVEQQLGSRFNSVLANYYRDGNDSVSWHADDEPELGLNPLIASLSFG